MLHTPLEVIEDLDDLVYKIPVEDVIPVYGVYSKRNLEDWLDTFSTSKNITTKQHLVIEQVKQLLIIM